MKRKITISILCMLLVYGTFLSAQETKSFSIEVQPIFQYRKSTIGEYVFIHGWEDISLLSDLQWKLSHIFLAGAGLNFSKDRFNASLSVLSGFPGAAGSMTDSDFYTSSPSPSLFSSHDASITALLDVCVSAGFDVVQAEKVTIQCFASVQYNETGATSYDGYQVNYLHTIPVVQDFTGQIISYTQYLLFSWIGSKWKIQPAQPLLITFSMAYAPFSIAKGWDIHHLRRLEFLDSMKSFYALKGGISITLSITKALSLSVGTEGLYLPLVKGITGVKEEGGNAFFEQNGYLGGTSLSEARFSASVSYTFAK